MIIQPSVFVSHGAPNLLLVEDEVTEKLGAFRFQLPARPRAIVVVSAHGLSAPHEIEVSADARHELLYDFRGFQAEMYQQEYPCPGDPELAAEVVQRLSVGGFTEQSVTLTRGKRIDHGIWVPLKLMFPEADVPIVPVSLPYPTEPATVLRMGKALAELRREGVMILGSGGAVHNLSQLNWAGKAAERPLWSSEFEDWLRDRVEARDIQSLLDFEDLAPSSRQAHPSSEHLLPLFFALGATLPGDAPHTLTEGFQYGSLSMWSLALQPVGVRAH